MIQYVGSILGLGIRKPVSKTLPNCYVSFEKCWELCYRRVWLKELLLSADPVTGIPSVPPGTTWCVMPNHNLNLMLHQQLFPECQPLVVSSERLSRYERALSKGHRTSLEDNRLAGDSDSCLSSQLDAKVLKQQVIKCLQDGFKLRWFEH